MTLLQTETLLSPEQVLAICLKRWPNGKGGKRANMQDPLLGSDASWADLIRICENSAIAILSNLLDDRIWRKREMIAMRRIVDTCLRNASEPANFYAMPLYISGGLLKAFENRTEKTWPGFRTEHVLPLAVYASCTNIAADPVGCIPHVRKAMIGPICRVTADEDNRLERKGTPDPARPFLRYRGLIEAYNTVTGERIDPDNWTFDDHVALMKEVPAYSTGADLYAGADNPWNDLQQKFQILLKRAA